MKTLYKVNFGPNSFHGGRRSQAPGNQGHGPGRSYLFSLLPVYDFDLAQGVAAHLLLLKMTETSTKQKISDAPHQSYSVSPFFLPRFPSRIYVR
jgi:hypothetical protein